MDKDINKKLPSIGGQAVMEGVMMRNGDKTAITIRKKKGLYSLKTYNTKKQPAKKPWYKRWAFVRGVVNFVDMMKLGITSLNDSVKMLDMEEEEPTKFEKWLAEKTGKDVMDIAMSVAIVFGIGFAVLLFVVAPNLLTTWISKSLSNSFLINLIEGLIRITIFICYILAITLLDDLKRFFAYHGAEHKTINAFEAGEKLTVENVQKHTTKHPRCGTSFLVFVMLISVIVFSLTGWEGQLWWQRLGMRILLLPVVASISYELLMGLAKKDNFLVRLLRWPGLQVQLLTTKEPDDEMVAAAIISSLAVMDDELFYQYCPDEFLHIHPDYEEKVEYDEEGEIIPAPKKEYEIIDFNKKEAKAKEEPVQDTSSDDLEDDKDADSASVETKDETTETDK